MHTRKPTVAAKALEAMAARIEANAKDSHTAWIVCGNYDAYGKAMQQVYILRRAAAEQSIYIRREMLRNAGIDA